MARGVRGENKPTRDGKTVRKPTNEAVEAVEGTGGVVFGCKPGLKVSTAGSGVCEGPRLVLVRIAAFPSLCFYAGDNGTAIRQRNCA